MWNLHIFLYIFKYMSLNHREITLTNPVKMRNQIKTVKERTQIVPIKMMDYLNAQSNKIKTKQFKSHYQLL